MCDQMCGLRIFNREMLMSQQMLQFFIIIWFVESCEHVHIN